MSRPIFRKTGGAHDLVGADRGDHVIDRGEQRLADVKSRKAVAFQQLHAVTLARQPGCGGRAGRAAADDDHLAVERVARCVRRTRAMAVASMALHPWLSPSPGRKAGDTARQSGRPRRRGWERCTRHGPIACTPDTIRTPPTG